MNYRKVEETLDNFWHTVKGRRHEVLLFNFLTRFSVFPSNSSAFHFRYDYPLRFWVFFVWEALGFRLSWKLIELSSNTFSIASLSEFFVPGGDFGQLLGQKPGVLSISMLPFQIFGDNTESVFGPNITDRVTALVRWPHVGV